MNTFKFGDKVRVLRKSESGTWQEIGRGAVIGLAEGNRNSYVRYMDRDWPEILELAELININAPRIKVMKW